MSYDLHIFIAWEWKYMSAEQTRVSLSEPDIYFQRIQDNFNQAKSEWEKSDQSYETRQRILKLLTKIQKWCGQYSEKFPEAHVENLAKFKEKLDRVIGRLQPQPEVTADSLQAEFS